MGYSVKFFFVPLFLTHLLTLSVAQENPLFCVCSNGNGNFTTNSTYKTNLNLLFSSFNPNSENNYGFYNFSIGENSDQVNSIALCRGDVQPNVCLGCINNATTELRNRCPNQKEAVLWYDNCMFRYSNIALNGDTFRTDFNKSDNNNASNVSAFSSALDTLLNNLINRAASGSSLRKFATGTAPASPSYTIYALVQCIPSLSQQQCSYCLSQSLTQIPACCIGKQGGRVAGTSCNVRIETYSFYNASADGPSSLQPPPATILSPPGKGRNIIVIAVSTVGSLILVFLICIFIFLRVRDLKKKVEADKIQSADALQYHFSTIRAATSDFSDAVSFHPFDVRRQTITAILLGQIRSTLQWGVDSLRGTRTAGPSVIPAAYLRRGPPAAARLLKLFNKMLKAWLKASTFDVSPAYNLSRGLVSMTPKMSLFE